MNTDVLILGGGLTALTAAYEVISGSGKKVTLVCCGNGASPYIHGFCLPVGEGDSAGLLLEDTLRSGCGCTDPELAKTLAEGSLQLPRWLESLGLQVDSDNGKPKLLKSLGSSVARIVGIRNAAGPSVMEVLRKKLRESDRYTQRPGRAMELLVKNNRVIGARCFDTEEKVFYNCYARCVILATGGFSRLFSCSTNSSEMGGDGIAMAVSAGAGVRDLEFIQFEPCVATEPAQVAGKGIITTMFYEGAVLRNERGERFMLRYGPEGERVPKDVMAKRMARESGRILLDATAVPEQLWQTVYKPYLDRYLNCGIDLRTTPVAVAPAAHTSCGGVVIDSRCRTGVPGLIACGEVTGGLHGANRLGGNAGLETMVFGKVAGKSAIEAAEAELWEGPEDRRADIPADCSALRRRLTDLTDRGLGVVRSEKAMAAALSEAKTLLETLGQPGGSFEKLRLHHDIITIKLTLESALARKESLGCHEVENDE